MYTKWYISRLKEEKKIMVKELPQFKLFKRDDIISFEGWHTTTTSCFNFKLQLPLPTGYPDVAPSLYVTYPSTLRKATGESINSIGVSHTFHTLGNGPGGCVQICHIGSMNWDASKTCIGILFQGMLWCDAYAAHLRTGLNISEILENWRRRQKPWKMKKIGLNDSLLRWPKERTSEISWPTIGVPKPSNPLQLWTRIT